MFFIGDEHPLGWSIKGETDSNTERTRQQAVQCKWKQIGNRQDVNSKEPASEQNVDSKTTVSEQNVDSKCKAKKHATENLNSKRG